MKSKFLSFIFIISILINIVTAWNLIHKLQMFNTNQLKGNLGLVKTLSIGAEENLQECLEKSSDPQGYFLNLYRANRKISIASQELALMDAPVQSRYFVDVSPIREYLFSINEQLDIVQEDIINGKFNRVDSQTKQKITELAKDIGHLNEKLKKVELNRTDLLLLTRELSK